MQMRPCYAEIATRALEDNYRLLAQLVAPDAELLAVVKANAYGHGLRLCAPAVVRAGARWLGVTSVEEGLEARELCPQSRILVIGGLFPGQADALIAHHLTAVVWDRWQIEQLERAAHAAHAAPGSVPVHLEIDTGMSRQGIDPAQINQALHWFSPSSPLRLEAVMTHLYAADDATGKITAEQFTRLATVLKAITEFGLLPEWLNVGNSASLITGIAPQIVQLANRFGMKAMLRPGLVLYGLAPEFDPPFDVEPASLVEMRLKLVPVLSWKTSVTSVRQVPAGAVVGYSGTFVAVEPLTLALLPVGYADGLSRLLGNRFSLLVHGQLAPIVGRVSMDQTVIDITGIAAVQPGDEVVLLGRQGTAEITAQDHARASQTISWDVFTRISSRVERREV